MSTALNDIFIHFWHDYIYNANKLLKHDICVIYIYHGLKVYIHYKPTKFVKDIILKTLLLTVIECHSIKTYTYLFVICN